MVLEYALGFSTNSEQMLFYSFTKCCRVHPPVNKKAIHFLLAKLVTLTGVTTLRLPVTKDCFAIISPQLDPFADRYALQAEITVASNEKKLMLAG